MSTQPHGTYARYQRGPDGPCRCDACKIANRDYTRAYRNRRADTWVNRELGACVRGLGWPRAGNEYSVNLESE